MESADNIEQAVLIALDYFDKIFPKEKELRNVMLEEVTESEEDIEHWEVTIGYSRLIQATTAQQLAGRQREVREYKVFSIRKSDGKVISITMRHLQF